MTKSKLKDHREIGRELDLFMIHEYAPGAIFWLPKGWTLYKTLIEFIRSKIEPEGYQEISTPVMIKSKLFEKSGHWEHFKDNMFNLSVWEPEEEEEAKSQIASAEKKISERASKTKKSFVWDVTIRGNKVGMLIHVDPGTGRWFPMFPVNYSLKPMNCPESAIVYSSKTRSYNDLPIRLSEFGILHRRELMGVLGGALRVRQFTIDDAHIFLRPDQIQEEINKLIKLVIDVYKSLGFSPRFYLATRPDKAMGDEKTWHKAEKDLGLALKEAKVNFDIKPKDGVFYGPKIDIHIKDSQDRDWQLATIQLDFQIPERMDLGYVDKDGKKKNPVMIHRAITGSIERFIGILIEHFQGAFPVWLSPVQAIVLPLSDKFHVYARRITTDLKSVGIRVEVDARNETLQAKIRDATLQKIPYLLVVGEKEEKAQTVAVRTRDDRDHRQMKIDQFKREILAEIENKS